MEIVINFVREIKKRAIFIDAMPTDESMTDPDDAFFYEIVMEARKETDAYLVTGNIKHFPKKPYVVTPKEMIDIMNNNQ